MIQQYGRGWNMTVVVGASASGLTAAIVAARRGEKIVVLEAGGKAARKIYASGNGRCNIGNSAISLERYHSRDMEVLAKILASCDQAQLRSYLNSLGIVTQEEAEGKLFPMSRQASSVVEALLFEAARAGVEILYRRKVVDIEKGAGGGYILHCESGERFEAPRLLLCSGSPAAPGLGGDSGILAIVGERFGHEVLKPLPSLSALRSASRYCRMASGVKLPAKVTLLCDSLVETERRGDILFTDYGISGLAILDISRSLSLAMEEGRSCSLKIDLLPDYERQKLESILLKRIERERGMPLSLWLNSILHSRLVPVIMAEAGVKLESEAQLKRRDIARIVYAVKNLSLPIEGTRAFKYAETACGGVSLREIDPRNMESKLSAGLFFAGEILDVDGDRGGFNLHFAWCSGIRAGMGISRPS